MQIPGSRRGREPLTRHTMVLSAPSVKKRNLAYVSEPITRCPPRERSRIQNLIKQMQEDLGKDPFGITLYSPSLVSSPEVRGDMKPEDVYLLDRLKVAEADFLLACADHTSFGIGGEVELAASMGKPVIIFSRAERLSRFLVGTPANAVRVVDPDQYYLKYRAWRDLKPQLLPVVKKVLEEPGTMGEQGFKLWDVGRHVRQLREERGMSMLELASKAGLRSLQLDMLEKPFDQLIGELAAYEGLKEMGINRYRFTDHQLEQVSDIGVSVLHKLAAALNVSASVLLGEEKRRANSKGPLRQATSENKRFQEARLESLKSRAAQYDITFRQYQQLREHLVTDYFRNQDAMVGGRSRPLIQIGEKEFLDALAALPA